MAVDFLERKLLLLIFVVAFNNEVAISRGNILPKEVLVKLGGEVRLNCTDQVGTRLVWHLPTNTRSYRGLSYKVDNTNSHVIIQQRINKFGRIMNTSTHQLVISNFSIHDIGNYICESSHGKLAIIHVALSYSSSGNCDTDQYFTCRSNGQCIERLFFCDGIADCHDHSDELDCRLCLAGQFRCHNGQCIPHHLQCDTRGISHCGDQSDLMDCPKILEVVSYPSEKQTSWQFSIIYSAVAGIVGLVCVVAIVSVSICRLRTSSSDIVEANQAMYHLQVAPHLACLIEERQQLTENVESSLSQFMDPPVAPIFTPPPYLDDLPQEPPPPYECIPKTEQSEMFTTTV